MSHSNIYECWRWIRSKLEFIGWALQLIFNYDSGMAYKLMPASTEKPVIGKSMMKQAAAGLCRLYEIWMLISLHIRILTKVGIDLMQHFTHRFDSYQNNSLMEMKLKIAISINFVQLNFESDSEKATAREHYAQLPIYIGGIWRISHKTTWNRTNIVKISCDTKKIEDEQMKKESPEFTTRKHFN